MKNRNAPDQGEIGFFFHTGMAPSNDHILSNITIESIPLQRIVLKFSLHLLLTQVLFRLLEKCISLKLDYHLLLFAEKLAKMQFCLQ